jgi:hypothetical protein
MVRNRYLHFVQKLVLLQFIYLIYPEFYQKIYYDLIINIPVKLKFIYIRENARRFIQPCVARKIIQMNSCAVNPINTVATLYTFNVAEVSRLENRLMTQK